jgi:hypothetical protein
MLLSACMQLQDAKYTSSTSGSMRCDEECRSSSLILCLLISSVGSGAVGAAGDGAEAADAVPWPCRVAMNCCSPVGWGGTAPEALYVPAPPAGGVGVGVCGWL